MPLRSRWAAPGRRGQRGWAAAQLLFDLGDCAWHLVSTPELIASQALHAGPGQAQLLPVPVLRWSQINPVLTELALSDDPFEAVALQERLHRADASVGVDVEQRPVDVTFRTRDDTLHGADLGTGPMADTEPCDCVRDGSPLVSYRVQPAHSWASS